MGNHEQADALDLAARERCVRWVWQVPAQTLCAQRAPSTRSDALHLELPSATRARRPLLERLLWDAVDLEAGTLTVRWALQRQKGKGLVLVPPKSKAGRRTIKLPEQLREALRRHRVRQNEQRLAAANVWEDGGFVFCQGNGRPIDARRDWLDWKALLKAAGVRNARLHDARHTAATMLLQQGVPARVAMQILGHSHIALTLGTYSHVVPEIAEEAAERIQRALWD